MHNYVNRAVFLRKFVIANIRAAMKKRNAIKWMPVLLALLILTQAVLPTVGWLIDKNLYQLSDDALRVVGSANQNLSAKFTYDEATKSWMFNKEGKALKASQIAEQQGQSAANVASALSQLQAKVGGGGKKSESLYSVKLPTDAKEGVKFYDNQTSQSFSMIPQFTTGIGKKWQGRIVYPFDDNGQVVYTAKTNGIKEDIVLNQFVSKELSYSYDLKLPSSLEARLLEDGSVGVFSADLALYGDITYSSDADREKVESARSSAEKTHMVFAIPAPIVKDAKNRSVKAAYTLHGNKLTVTARHLHQLTYPVSIDPSVVVTSTSDFQAKGNDEGMIDWSSSGQAGRSMVVGADTGAWATTSSFGARYLISSVVNNGYIYAVGGNGDGSQTAVRYAPINTDGTLGTWGLTSDLINERLYPSATVYNGYMYVYGGVASGGTSIYNTVDYAPINANGTLGTWQRSANTMAQGVCRNGYGVYNGYLYAIAGGTSMSASCANSGTTVSTTVQFAPILANGDVGTWTITTPITTARMSPAVTTYNGFIYMMGGTVDGTSSFGDVQYAKLNSDGTITSWMSGPSLVANGVAASRYRHSMVAYKGYIYTIAGTGIATNAQYARINADGSLDNWGSTSTNFNTQRYSVGFSIYNDRMYLLAGAEGGAAVLSDVQYANIKSLGSLSTPVADTGLGSNPATGSGASYASNGCIYLVGGYTTAQTAAVYSASINTNGTLSAWTQSPNSLNTAVERFGFAVVNNRMYVIGGNSATGAVNSVQYATINTSGCGTGTWTTNTTNLPNEIWNQPATSYNNKLYIVGTTVNNNSDRVNYATVNTDGSVGSWTYTSANLLPTASTISQMVAYAGYLYVLGGGSNSVTSNAVYFAKINTDGSYGSWTATSSLNTARARFQVFILNGYIYALGGTDAAKTTYYSSTERAQINPNGSLSSWTFSTDMGVQLSDYMLAQDGDRVYTVAGYSNTTRIKNVYRIVVNSGGGGALKSWATTTNLTSARYNNAIVIKNGFIYTSGGYGGGTYLNTVQYAPINANGSIGAWASTTSFATGREAQAMQEYNGFMYIFGGSYDFPRNYLGDVQYAPINADGTLGAWNTTTSLPIAGLAKTNVAMHNGYVYAGGVNSGGNNKQLHYAPINSDGTIGSWTATTNLSTPIQAASLAAYNGYLYAAGGLDAGFSATTGVEYAPINSDGTIGSWTATTNFPGYRQGQSMVMNNGYMYVTAGSLGSTRFNDVQYAPINENGTLGNWNTTVSYANPRGNSYVAINNGTMYIAGGFDGTTTFNDVQYATINVSPRIARYSTLVTLPSSGLVSNVYYNGVIGKGSSVTYKKAGINGVLGTLQNGVSGSGTVDSICTAAADKYVYITAILDDTQAVRFGSGYTPSYITDLTVNYGLSKRPDPSQRLFGGKSFQQEVLQEFDTCGT